MAQTFNSSIGRQIKKDPYEFEASLGYVASSGPARVIQQERFCLKQTNVYLLLRGPKVSRRESLLKLSLVFRYLSLMIATFIMGFLGCKI